jgi:hypothetical protein
MSHEETATQAPTGAKAQLPAHAPSPEDAPYANASPEGAYAPSLGDAWAEEPLDELPPRPRRRLLGAGGGAGGNPIALALLGVLLIACGFIGGVLVEKGQTSSSAGSGASGLASRLATLRGTGRGGAGSGGAGAGGAGAASGTGFAGRFGGFGAAGAGSATIGEVSYISGSTLYVTDTEGNTVKVTTSPASSITKTVKADIHGIHPGETVVVRGTNGSHGAVSAESISVNSGAAGGGIASLFGGGAASRSGGAGSNGAPGGSALFGG